MALDKLTNVANALSQRFASKLAIQFNRSTVTGQIIPTEPGYGKNVAWDVLMNGAELANGGVGSYAEGTDVVSGDFAQDVALPAVLSWASYRQAFAMTELELDAAGSSQGSAEALIRLLDTRVMGSVTALASKVNSDLLVGDGSDASTNQTIVGLLGGSLDATGTYAGLDRGTYPLWSGNVMANGGVARALTTDLMEQMLVNIYVASGTRPDVIICSPNVKRKYKSLLEPLRRLAEPVYKTSAEAAVFSGMDIFEDKDLVESGGKGTMIFLNRQHVSKVFLPVNSMSDSDGSGAKSMEGYGSNGEDKQSLSVPFRIVPLAKTGDYVKFMVKCVLQLKVNRPNAHGYISDIAV